MSATAALCGGRRLFFGEAHSRARLYHDISRRDAEALRGALARAIIPGET